MTNKKPILRIEAKHYGGDFLEIDLREKDVKILVESTKISENSEYVLVTKEQFAEAMDTLGYMPKPELTFAQRMDAAPVGAQVTSTVDNGRIYQKLANGTWSPLTTSGYSSENFSDTVYTFVNEEESK